MAVTLREDMFKRIRSMQAAGHDLKLDHDDGRFRLRSIRTGNVVSPHLSARSMWEWVDAYEVGWDARGNGNAQPVKS